MIRYAFYRDGDLYEHKYKIVFLKTNDSGDTMTPSENYLIVLGCFALFLVVALVRERGECCAAMTSRLPVPVTQVRC